MSVLLNFPSFHFEMGERISTGKGGTYLREEKGEHLRGEKAFGGKGGKGSQQGKGGKDLREEKGEHLRGGKRP